MPALHNLLKSCRGCHMLAHMQQQLPPAAISRASSFAGRGPRPQQASAGLRALATVHAGCTGPVWQQQQRRTCAACCQPLQALPRCHGSSCDGGGTSSSSSLGGLQGWARPLRSSSSSSRRARYQVCASQSGSVPQPPSGQPQPTKFLTLPTVLTLARVAAIPALVAAWFWQDPAATALVTGMFVAASVTDWLDGYLARKLNASTPFGAFLDPTADKLMVAAVLILLSTQPLGAGPLAGNAWLVPVCTLVIIGREITMSALREWAATMGPEARAAVAVNALGKWKTASQMVALTCLLATRDGAAGQLGAVAAAAGTPLLVAAAYLTAHSLAVYMAGLWRFMK